MMFSIYLQLKGSVYRLFPSLSKEVKCRSLVLDNLKREDSCEISFLAKKKKWLKWKSLSINLGQISIDTQMKKKIKLLISFDLSQKKIEILSLHNHMHYVLSLNDTQMSFLLSDRQKKFSLSRLISIFYPSSKRTPTIHGEVKIKVPNVTFKQIILAASFIININFLTILVVMAYLNFIEIKNETLYKKYLKNQYNSHNYVSYF